MTPWVCLAVTQVATHSSNLAWRIPWTEEPGELQPMKSQRVGQTERLSSGRHTGKLRTWVSLCESAVPMGWTFPTLPWGTILPSPTFLGA